MPPAASPYSGMPPAAGGASPPVPPTGKVPAPGTVLRFLRSKNLKTVPGAGTLPVGGPGGEAPPVGFRGNAPDQTRARARASALSMWGQMFSLPISAARP